MDKEIGAIVAVVLLLLLVVAVIILAASYGSQSQKVKYLESKIQIYEKHCKISHFLSKILHVVKVYL
jgi:rRNA pseudouridine-1189 N-methylase Emg1 (Nep1/Mra1 family)